MLRQIVHTACPAIQQAASAVSWPSFRLVERLWQQRAAAAAAGGTSTSGTSSSSNVHTSASCLHGGHSSDDEDAEKISVTFVSEKDGSETTVQVPIGQHLLEAAHRNDIELEGACEASLACSTCHVVVEDEDYFHKIPEPTEDELDMLDLAFGLTETSRLGCQVVASKELDGLRVKIPAATRNFYVDGHVPKPH